MKWKVKQNYYLHLQSKKGYKSRGEKITTSIYNRKR